MNRLRARVSSLALALALAAVLPAAAQSGNTSFWFGGTRLIFDRAIPLDGDVALATHDSGLQRFLARLGATIAFSPQQRYVIVTASDRRTITFTLGTSQYTAGGVTARAAFAPFQDGNDAIVPLYAIAHALYVEPVADGSETVLQPQIGALDIHADGSRTVVEVRGATALSYVKRVETPEHVELAFSGVGSTLTGSRRAGALAAVTIVSGGSPKNPTTVITFDAPRGSSHLFLAVNSPYAVDVAFAEPGVFLVGGPAPPVAAAPPTALPPAAVPPPVAVASPAPSPAFEPPAASDVTPAPLPAGRAVVTNITLQPAGDGLTIHVAVSGSADFEWHRLADQRWYLDVLNATLTDAGRDERPAVAAVDSVRIRQTGTNDAPFVRIALTLRGEKRVDVQPAPDGLTIVATNADALAAARTGTGHVGTAVALGEPGIGPQSATTPNALASPAAPGIWKFAPGGNSRIIVLDPGHGGDDTGTAHNGLMEKTLTLDIARRLRTLLTAQGWTVRMTRDSDIDPVSQENLAAMRADGKPNPDDRAYLQTRADVANSVNARLFISIHVNYSDSSSVNGTTFYWYKPQDQPFAVALEHAVIPVAGTSDDGPRHENLYVVRHTTMPAVLIETAFISNPHDVALLRTPAFLQDMAQGIANGVKAFAGSPPIQASRADE
jgi:N-acetylmuramoyl-L-alanine amidase